MRFIFNAKARMKETLHNLWCLAPSRFESPLTWILWTLQRVLIWQIWLKGIVHFKKKLLLIIYSPPCHPRCPCVFFLQTKRNEGFWWKHSGIFLHIMDFNGNQPVQGPNESFSAASKGFKQHQMMNKGLIKRNNRSFQKYFRVMTRRVLDVP